MKNAATGRSVRFSPVTYSMNSTTATGAYMKGISGRASAARQRSTTHLNSGGCSKPSARSHDHGDHGFFDSILERHLLRLPMIALLPANLANGSRNDARIISFGLKRRLKVPCCDDCRAARNTVPEMPFELDAQLRRQLVEQILGEHPTGFGAGATGICLHAIEHLLSGSPLSPHALPFLSAPTHSGTISPRGVLPIKNKTSP
jgi:hypothetical protein